MSATGPSSNIKGAFSHYRIGQPHGFSQVPLVPEEEQHRYSSDGKNGREKSPTIKSRRSASGQDSDYLQLGYDDDCSNGNTPDDGHGHDKKEQYHAEVLQTRVPQLIPYIADALETIQPHEKRRRVSLVDEKEKVFTKHAEDTWVELFFDLFFLANLATFTDAQQINDSVTLQAYIGYFSALWFTWLQVVLFDLRFGKDSFYQRIGKAVQIGVLMGFSAVNSNFFLNRPDLHYSAFQTLTLLLMASRISLVLQYFGVWTQVRQYPKTRYPLLLMTSLLVCSSAVYLGLFWAFGPDKNTKSFAGWYVTFGVETIAMLLISSNWRIVSFETTHLIQRMGLITLIIIGEGIIGISRTINQIVQGYGWTDATTGQAISAVLSIYLLFMLYFDDEPMFEYSTVNQQLWAVLHFPLHFSIVLYVEGQQQLILWHNVVQALEDFMGVIGNSIEGIAVNNGPAIAQALEDSVQHYFSQSSSGLGGANTLDSQALSYLFDLRPVAASNNQTFIFDQITGLIDLTTFTIFAKYGIKPAYGFINSADDDTTQTNIDQFENIYELVFIYYYVSAAAILIIMALFTFLIKRKKDRYDWLRIGYRVLFALTLGLLCLIKLNNSSTNYFIESVWVLPVMLLVMFVFFCIDRITVYYSVHYSHKNWYFNKHHGQGGEAPKELPRELIQQPQVLQQTASADGNSTLTPRNVGPPIMKNNKVVRSGTIWAGKQFNNMSQEPITEGPHRV